MNSIFPVMLGGALGAGGRHLMGQAIAARLGVAFPWHTLTINILGCLAMGVLIGGISRLGGDGAHWRLFLGVGVLGGFTTFSAFSMETWLLIERGQSGAAAAYALASLLGTLAACGIGLWAMRTITA